MTNRVQYLTVILDQDFRDDDVQILADAIKQMRHVSNVELGKPVLAEDHMARERVKHELLNEIYELISKK